MSALPWFLMTAACGRPDHSPGSDPIHDSVTAETRDEDSDGFGEDDCDDAHALVFPGAPETCDALDNDCDGAVDEEAVDALTWHRDADGDGYGSDTESVVQCSAPDDFVAALGDCDDTLASVHPGADEVCDDGVDNDCVVGGHDACRLQGVLADDVILDIDNPYSSTDIFADTSALASVGDVIGSDAPDLLLGLPRHDHEPADAGAAVLCAGPLGAIASLETCAFIAGQLEYGFLGASATGTGDLNEDGVDDFLVGEPGFIESNAYFFYGPVTDDRSVGEADVVISRARPRMGLSSARGPVVDGSPTVAVSELERIYLLDPTEGGGFVEAPGYPGLVATLVGAPHSNAGEVVHDMGDVTGDGLSDLGIGSNPVSSHTDAPPAVYLVVEPSAGLTSLYDTEARFDRTNHFGVAGDENGDGYADVLVESEAPSVLRLFLGPVDGEYDVSEAGEEEASIHLAPLAANSLDPTGVDFDGDSLSDIAFVSFVNRDGEIGLYVQYAPVTGALEASKIDLTVSTTSKNLLGALENVGDTDHDGHEDLIATSFGDLYLLLGQGI
jgi:hypothetical protein